MLLIWSALDSQKTLTALAEVLATKPCEVVFASSLNEAQVLLPKATAVLAMGAAPLKDLQDLKVVPKNRSTASLRTRVLPWIKPLMVTYSPGVKEVDYRTFIDCLCDTRMAFKLAATGSIQPKMGNYTYVDDLKPVVARAKALLGQHSKIDLMFDTETVGLDYVDPTKHLVSMQFTFEPGEAQVVYFESREKSDAWLRDLDNQADLGWLLSNPNIRVSGANGKYDLLWVWFKAGIECTNYVFDTTLVGSLLDENRSNGLDIHAKIYTDMGGYSDEFDRTIDKSRMDLVPKEKLLPYAAGDTDAGLRVKQAQKELLLQDGELTRFYVHVLHPAARAFEIVERGGVVVDLEEYKLLEADLLASMNSLAKRAKELMGGRIVAKHWDPDKPGGLNLGKASLLIDYMFSPMGLNLKPKMFTEKSKAPSSTLEHLEMFSGVPEAAEFVKVMGEYTSASKTLSTYVTGFKQHLRSDGRFHPTYFLFVGNRDDGEGGTNTGRLSAKDPAFQTIPKHTIWGKRIRRVFKAPDGMLVLENDYSQGELKVIACIAHEEVMIHAYQNNMDLHVATSGFVAGLTYEEMVALSKSDPEKYDSLRQLGKAGNFGLIYGMGVDGFIEYARTQYGVTLEYQAAAEFHAGFFNRYPALPAYHRSYKAFARKHGFVRSPLGRVRHLPLIRSAFSDIQSKAERQAVNSPVQGTLSDMMIWCIALGVKNGWHHECPPFGMIHDAKYTYIPEDNYQMYAKREVDLMENLPFHELGWNPQLKFTADAKVGKNMADLSKVKF